MGALLRESWANYQRHNSQWLAAALAYFAAFAIAPLIIVIVEIAGFFLQTHQSVLDVIYGYLHNSAGAGGDAVKAIVTATFDQPQRSAAAQAVEWGLFVIASVGLFNAVQFALNTIWDVAPQKMTIARALRQRLTGFAVMLAMALLLLLTMLLTAGLTVALTHLPHAPATFDLLVKATGFVLTFFVLWAAFAVTFVVLPECHVHLHDVWIGAGITSFFFAIGQFVVGFYLGHVGITSAYGAFGSLIALLIWVNYSAQIVLFGAEVTHVYALRHGSRKVRLGT